MFRHRIRRLEREAARDRTTIPQRTGAPRTFPRRVAAAAFVALMEGRDHPLLHAARGSSDPAWSEGVYATDPATLRDVPDLSE